MSSQPSVQLSAATDSQDVLPSKGDDVAPGEVPPEPRNAGAALPVGQVPEKVFQSLDQRHIVAEQIGSVITWLVITLFAVLGYLIWLAAAWPPGRVYWFAVGGAAVASALLLWAALGLPRVEHRHARWRVDESGLEIHRGIFWRREITIPRARVQHTDVRQGPLQRRYGIATLVIHTAGTHAASCELPGLSVPIAKWLRDVLINEVQREIDVV
jgi:hypothetical protein